MSYIVSNHNAMKLEVNHNRKSGKNPNTWRLNQMLLNDEWINQEIKEGEKKKTTGRQNETVKNLWGAAKANPGGKFIAIQVYLKKQEKS